MKKARVEHAAAVGVAENGNSAVLVTIARRELIDRRKVDLTRDTTVRAPGRWVAT
jgi:hypothetical protein